MSKSRNFLLFALATTFILTFSPVEAAKHMCTNPRPTQPCETLVYAPVCAYTTKNCPFSVCGSTVGDFCSACMDKDVAYYIDGECPRNVEVSTCDADTCGPWDYYSLEKGYYNPVCAIERNCPSKSSSCEKTINNVCDSCSKSRYPFYQLGPCEHDRNYCPTKRPSTCPTKSEPVCANLTDSYGETKWVTVDNSCNACKVPKIDYYVKGACGRPLNNETYCLPTNGPQICPAIYNPVCVFYNTSDGTIEHKVVSNACNACGVKNALYHTPGPCVFYCQRTEMIAVDCAGDLSPVCGSYKENGITKRVSLRNGCISCHGNSILFDSYTEGLCPGDNGLLCKNNGLAMVEGLLEPVCGLKTLNCASSSCRKTFGDTYSVCEDPSYVKYIPGPCPGDKGVPCTDFRNGNPNDDKFTYSDVCGYKKNNSKQNYSDQFAACANSNVVYFTAGPC